MPPSFPQSTPSPAATPQAPSAPIASGSLGASSTPEVQIRIASNPLYLSGTRELVAGVARRLGFADDACNQIALAVDEALANVIRHGYQRAPDKPIWISLFPSAEPGRSGPFGDTCPCQSLRIVIEDEARQVDPAVIKSRDLDEIRPGGLGVHIIRTVMDHVSYEKRDKLGMRLTMIKNRACENLAGDVAKSEGGGGACCGQSPVQERPNG